MFKFFLCLKYLRRRKIVFLSIAAVGLSTALLVTVASMFTGFISAIQSSASDYLGDVVIEPPVRFWRYDKLVEELNALPGVSACSPGLSTHGLLHLGPGHVRAVKIWGVDPVLRSEVTDFKEILLMQGKTAGAVSFAYDGIDEACFVGIGLVADVDAETDEYDFSEARAALGKKIVLTMGGFGGDGGGTGPRSVLRSLTRQLTVSDIFFTGVHDTDQSIVFLPIGLLSQLLYSREDAVIYPADVMHIKCAEGFRAGDVLADVNEVWSSFASSELNWPGYYISRTDIITSVEKQSKYISELRKQMGMLLVIFGIISFGVVVLIFCIFYMIVVGKQKDIAVIKSLGAGGVNVASLFLFFGFAVGLVGSFLGVGIGYFVTHNVNTIERWIQVLFGLKLWSSSVYIFDKIPNEFSWGWAFCFLVFATLASVVGAAAPAIVAARTLPARILRYE